jgi:hypothetical protein
MSKTRRDGQVIHNDHNTVYGNGCIIFGNHNKVYGDDIVVNGCHNSIVGSCKSISGSHNKLTGSCDVMTGSHNKISGSCTSDSGCYNKIGNQSASGSRKRKNTNYTTSYVTGGSSSSYITSRGSCGFSSNGDTYNFFSSGSEGNSIVAIGTNITTITSLSHTNANGRRQSTYVFPEGGALVIGGKRIIHYPASRENVSYVGERQTSGPQGVEENVDSGNAIALANSTYLEEDTEQNTRSYSAVSSSPAVEEQIEIPCPSNNTADDEAVEPNISENIANACTICMVKRARAIFFPCNHVICCLNCARELVAGKNISDAVPCPICRTSIARVEMVYLA